MKIENREFIIGESAAMKSEVSAASRVAKSAAPVLLVGEPGTGKSILARGIHEWSDRSSRPFGTLNCAALPATLLEGELFGFEKGDYSEERNARPSQLEELDGGTLHLEEIGELDLDSQVRLLEYFSEKVFRRNGSQVTRTADVRIVASTSADVRELIRKRKLREDFYYRISPITISLPALRQRLEDVPALAGAFLSEFAKQASRNVSGFDENALEAMMNYDWPGNVRQMRNVIHRAVLMCEGDRITSGDLPPEIVESKRAEPKFLATSGNKPERRWTLEE